MFYFFLEIFWFVFVYFNYFQIYLFKIEGAKNQIVWFVYYPKIDLIRLAHRIAFYSVEMFISF